MADAPDDPRRQFDFWLGAWRVVDEDGEPLGTNAIRSVHDGHALEERWTGASGVTGSSLSTYDAADGAWVQCWVDDAGRLIDLRGGVEDGAMRLAGTLSTADGDRVPFRGTWTAEGPDRVVQHFDVRPEGDDWTTWFHGLYERAAD